MTMTYGACGSDATGALLPFGFVRMPTSRAAPGVRRGRPRAAEARRGVKQKAWFCGRPGDVIDGIKWSRRNTRGCRTSLPAVLRCSTIARRAHRRGAGVTLPHGEPRNTPFLKNTRNGVVPLALPSNDFHGPFVRSVPPCAGCASRHPAALGGFYETPFLA